MAESYYERIIADIRARIASGEWPPGSRLPTNVSLRDFYRKELGVPTLAMATLAHALTVLKATGELRGQQGAGIFVTGKTPPD